MSDFCACGNEIEEHTEAVTSAGGWCAPSEVLYKIEVEPMCSDCRTRMMMMAELGIDPGRNGENLRVRRGGIMYG